MKPASMPDIVDDLEDRMWHATTVARVLGGDVDTFAELVARHRDRLLRYAVRMLSDTDEAEDVTQETFVRAYRALATCDDPSRFGGWIFTILANRCRTAGARRARRESLFVPLGARERSRTVWVRGNQDGIAVDGVDGGDGVDAIDATDATAAADACTDGRMDRALMRLNCAQREAFLLKYVEEMNYDDMALLTGAGVSALKMRVSRAREVLRAALLEEEG